jgi:serine/threonine-protein phosphatase 6 regulatory ankyrin repeat subunit B
LSELKYYSSSALHWAAEGNSAEAAQHLLEMGMPIDQLNECDETALSIAMYRKHHDFAKILMKHGARWHAVTRDGLNVLDVAIAENDVQTAKLLLGLLYSAQETTDAGDPALDNAIRKRDLKEALRLLNNGRSLAQRELKRL